MRGARQDLKKNAEEEPKPKHGNGNHAERMEQKREDGTSISLDDAFLLVNMSRALAA